MSDNGRVTAYTTFQPDVPIDMDESEYASLLRQGLIVVKPDGEPVDENAPADLVDQESPTPAPRKSR